MLLLAAYAAPARAVYADLRGAPLAADAPGVQLFRIDGAYDAAVEVVRAREAAQLLRLHGGEAVAALVREEVLDGDFWAVALRGERVAVASFGGDEHLWSISTEYARVPSSFPTLAQLISDKRSSEVAWLAAELTGAVLERQVEVEVDGRTKTFRLTAERLAFLLLNVYGDEPEAVAEAILSLIRMKGNKQRWLKRVLWGRPELRTLARRVQAVLTGR